MAIKFNENIKPSAIEEKFIQLFDQLLPPTDYGLYDLRYLSGSSTLRVFITKSNDVKGIDINDCIKVNKLISPLIESENWVPENFVIEVSSPGLFRDIRFADQLKYSVGELVKVKFNSQVSEKSLQNKHYIGKLLGYNETEMTVIAAEEEKMIINYDMVKSVNAELKI
jgi:ribosome maturation factor RimP